MILYIISNFLILVKIMLFNVSNYESLLNDVQILDYLLFLTFLCSLSHTHNIKMSLRE